MKNQLPSIQAVLFDVGGTLLHPDYSVVQRLLTDYQVRPDLAAIRSAEGRAKDAALQSNAIKPWKAYFGTWFTELGAREADLPSLIDRIWRQHRQRNLWRKVASDAASTLVELKRRGFRLGVISNSDGKVAELLASVNLAKHFEVIVDSEIVGVRKPDPRIFEIALHRLNLNPAHTVYIGDMYAADVAGAKAAGLHAILFQVYGEKQVHECLQISRLAEILQLV